MLLKKTMNQFLNVQMNLFILNLNKFSIIKKFVFIFTKFVNVYLKITIKKQL